MHFPRQLPPREFILQMTLYYTLGGQLKTHLFFNETVNIIEEPTLFDTQLIGLYIIGLALLAAACECGTLGRAGWVGMQLAAWGRLWVEGVRIAVLAYRGSIQKVRCSPHAHATPSPCHVPQFTGAPSLARARAGSRSPSPPPGQVRTIWGQVQAALRGAADDSRAAQCEPLSNCINLDSTPPTHSHSPGAAAASTNKEEWLRGTAADPKLRKKQ